MDDLDDDRAAFHVASTFARPVCHVIDIDADSWRDKERLERSGRPPCKPKR